MSARSDKDQPTGIEPRGGAALTEIGVGIVGCGGMAQIHSKCLAEMSGVKIAATYDTSRETRMRLAEQVGAEPHDSLEGLLSSDSVNAVYILTPHDSHPEIVRQCIRFEKPAVFCEKPLGLDLAALPALSREIKKSRILFTMGFNHRFNSGVMRLKRTLADSAGSPLLVTIHLAAPHFLQSWAGLWPSGGGVLPCLGSHGFDLARYIVGGEVTELSCHTERLRLSDPYLDDTAVITARFTTGTTACLVLHDHAPPRYAQDPGRHLLRIEVFTGRSVIATEPLSHLIKADSDAIKSVKFEPYSLLGSWGFLEENRHFIQCVREGTRASPNEDDGLEAVRLVELAKLAAREGRLVRSTEIELS